MKRFTALIATAALIIALFPLYATAAGITKYYITDDIVVTIDTAGGVLTVSGTGAMPDYSKASGTPWYANGSVKRVVVKDGITSVGNRAFSGNSATIEVELGESVERIGTSAFSNCKNLLSVTLPKSLKTIESFAFSNCTSLETVSFPDSLRSIGDSAFMWDINIQTITYGGTVEQWNAIKKQGNWCLRTRDVVVVCTDGTIEMSNPVTPY